MGGLPPGRGVDPQPFPLSCCTLSLQIPAPDIDFVLSLFFDCSTIIDNCLDVIDLHKVTKISSVIAPVSSSLTGPTSPREPTEAILHSTQLMTNIYTTNQYQHCANTSAENGEDDQHCCIWQINKNKHRRHIHRHRHYRRLRPNCHLCHQECLRSQW